MMIFYIKAAIEDLKLCISNLSQQTRFPGRRNDFATDEAYSNWRQQELSTLQQTMLKMIKSNPDLVQTQFSSNGSKDSNSSGPLAGDDFVVIAREGASTPVLGAHPSSTSTSQRNSLARPDSISSLNNITNPSTAPKLSLDESLAQMLNLGTQLEAELIKTASSHNNDPNDYDLEIVNNSTTDEDEPIETTTKSFTYVPPNPPTYYIKLMDQCLDYDLESMKNLAEDEEVSLKILTSAHLEILELCSFRWRLMSPFQVLVFFNGICKRFEDEEIPIIECVIEALNDVFKLLDEIPLDHWTIRDVRSLFFSSLFFR